MDDFTGDLPLDTTSAPSVDGSSVPATQPDFNVSGSNANPTAVLAGIAQTVTSVAGAIGAINTASANAAFNRAATAQGQALSLQQLATQGKLAQLQSATQLAQAQQQYNRAAGVGVPSATTIIVVLTIAGVVLTAMQLAQRRKK